MHDLSHHFRYRLFGLSVASAVELPELPPDKADGPADIMIEIGVGWREGGYPLVVDDVATFTISDGRVITISPVPGVPPRNMRLFLLGSAMGVLLHQRGFLPLHANAVVIDGKAIAFTGPSGVGKSTLAAWFHDHGYGVLADDVCVIASSDEGGGLEVRPGLPRLRLWRDALERSGRSAEEHEPSFAGTADERDKYDVLLERSGMEAAPLLAVVELVSVGQVDFRRLNGAEAARALIENTYRGHLVSEIGDTAAHFELCVRTAREVPVWEARRPDSGKLGSWARALLTRLSAV